MQNDRPKSDRGNPNMTTHVDYMPAMKSARETAPSEPEKVAEAHLIKTKAGK